MSTISVSNINDGDAVTAASVNSQINTIVNDYNGNITDANIATGAAIGAQKIAGGITGMFGAWSSYTPTVSSVAGTITTSSATGRYIQVGKTVIGRFDVTITTNGSGATGVTVTVPVAAQANNAYVGSGREDGVSGKIIQAQLTSSTTVTRVFFYDGTYPGANSAVLRINFVYEAA